MRTGVMCPKGIICQLCNRNRNSDNLCSKTATSNLIKHLKVYIYNFNITFSIFKTFHYLLFFCRSTHFLICYTKTDIFAIHVKIMISGLKYVLVLVLDVSVLDVLEYLIAGSAKYLYLIQST